MSTGTGFVRRKTDCVTLGRLKNSGCVSAFVQEETARLMFQPSDEGQKQLHVRVRVQTQKSLHQAPDHITAQTLNGWLRSAPIAEGFVQHIFKSVIDKTECGHMSGSHGWKIFRLYYILF